MKRPLLLLTMGCAVLFAIAQMPVQGVELLKSGNFEPPLGVGEIPFWTVEEFATGSTEAVDAASPTGGDVRLWLRAFSGGGPLHQRQGNFDEDHLPRGEVDGVDFLSWQRGFGIPSGAVALDGDATGGAGGIPDGKVDVDDYNIWRGNFGYRAPLFTNARIFQSVPASPGETYTFQGTATLEDNYSGWVSTLGDDSPFGTIPSETTTTFRMEFLNGSNAVIGSKSLNLKSDYSPGELPGFPKIHTPVVDVAPAGTERVRVVAEALNMAWNGTTATPGGPAQSAFFNDFLLKKGAETTNLLQNGDLNLVAPSALDFWTQIKTPDNFPSFNNILTTVGFANRVSPGTLGVWLHSFLGASQNRDSNWSTVPVDGSISQEVQGVAGATYTFSGWSRFEPNYSGGVDVLSTNNGGMLAGMASPTKTEIKLQFLDVDKQLISESVIDVEAARIAIIGGSANDGSWRQHSKTAVSPAGTRFVRFVALMDEGAFNTDSGGGQSAFFDDFSLDGPLVMFAAVPEPSSLAGLALGALFVWRRRRKQ